MTIDWENIRTTQFPALKNLTYIMAGSASPLSEAAYKNGVAYFKDMLYFGDIHFDTFCEKIEKVRETIAEYINAKAEEIAFLPNTSSGMNIIARFLKEGEILYPSIEFPASIHIFKRLGFPNKKIIDQNHCYIIEDFKSSLSDETKYIIHSHVQSLTGFRQNLEELGAFCKKNNLTNISNATQSFCSFEIDVKKQNIDMLVSNALKWGACGYGAGFLYIDSKLLNDKEIPFSSWLSVENPFSLNNDNLKIINQTKYMDTFGGCPNFAALLSLKGSLDLIKTQIGNGSIKTGIKRIQERIIHLTNIFVEEIKGFNLKIITPLDTKFRSGIITIQHDRAEEIYNFFIRNNIYVTLKRYPNLPKDTLLRFAFNYYNNEDDIIKVIKILKTLKI
ncbi:MAG: aminotransferase class V-fold PLP-dependent enzyme [Promethearchaeota archaeon]|jgi:selenocysteine lyase/cysteine desulfurase